MGTVMEDNQDHPVVQNEDNKINDAKEQNLDNKTSQNHYHESHNNGTSEKFKCFISADRLNHLRKRVEDAITEKKTFTVKGGYHCIRNALLHRGWIEKIEFRAPSPKSTALNTLTMDEVVSNLPPKQDWESHAAHIGKCEKMIISRLLQNHEVDFYWNLRKDNNEWLHRLNRHKIMTRFSRSLFTSKEGLCLLLQQLYWHNEPGVSFVRFPRCYTINFADQCTAFLEDFRLTACISLLKHFISTIHHEGEFPIVSVKGKVPLSSLQFAIDRCNEFINIQKHLDIDKEFHKIWDHEWEQFLTNFQLVVNNNEKYEENSRYNLYNLEQMAKKTLKNVVPYWPQFELDGIKNVWIMKPGNKCRGRDIKLIKDASDVLKVMNNKLKYVVQKYIERPLLIYKTKFDIRQWFLITCVQPLTIWMYRDCYLRFSSKKFNLDDFHESVHLTNHAVQHKYTNADRDKALPDDNMWDNHTFKAYLRQIGQAEKWYKVIYPGMRESIIGAMLASQETMDRRPNTFELYGADFMIAENFTPWLIEINSCPAMGPTTSVTARMCPQCFEDILKVVIDRRRDPKVETGLFELVYKQNLPQSPSYLGMTLSIKGRRLFRKRVENKHIKQEKDVPKSKNLPLPIKPKMDIELVKNYKGPVIGNLIEELHKSIFNVNKNLEEVLAVETKVVGKEKSTRHKKTALVQEKLLSQQTFKEKSNNFSTNSKLRKKETSTRTNKSTKQKSDTNENGTIITLNKISTSQAIKNTKKYDKNWEQETASILNNNICSSASMMFKNEHNKNSLNQNLETLKNNTIDPLSNFWSHINNKNSQTMLTDNLLTIGLGLKNSNYKQIFKENIMMLNKPSVTDHFNLKC